MANDSLLITKLPDGTFHVKETEDDDTDPNPPIDQSVSDAADVNSLVSQWLGEEESDDSDSPDMPAPDMETDPGDENGVSPPAAGPAAKAAWDTEAKSRGASGFRK